MVLDQNAKPCMGSRETPRQRTRPQADLRGPISSTYAGLVARLGPHCLIRNPVDRFWSTVRRSCHVDSRLRGHDGNAESNGVGVMLTRDVVLRRSLIAYSVSVIASGGKRYQPEGASGGVGTSSRVSRLGQSRWR